MPGDTSTLPAEGRENPGREHGEADDETEPLSTTDKISRTFPTKQHRLTVITSVQKP